MEIDSVLEQDLNNISKHRCVKEFRGKTILVTGITGLIGSLIVQSLLWCNQKDDAKIHIIGVARNEEKVNAIFGEALNNELVEVIYQDIMCPICVEQNIDYIIHGASITTSKIFMTNPVETINIAVKGTQNILELAKEKQVKKMVYLSSMEVYGIADESLVKVEEKDLGYIDVLNIRSCYSEGKRMCECLCAAYAKEYGVNVTIARLAQTFGAGVQDSENRVFAQFIKSVINRKNIVLHTEGRSYGNYCYTKDAIIGLFTLLNKGENGEAYNVSNEATTTTIKEMAEMVANKIAKGTIKVIIDLPKEGQVYGYAPDVKMQLCSDKLRSLGWIPEYNLEECYERTMQSAVERKIFMSI